MRIVFYGNHEVSYSSETHHCNSLEQLGHEVVRLQEPKTPAARIMAEAEMADMFVWVKTHGWETPGIDAVIERLRDLRVPIVTYHLDLYMPLQRWTRYESDPYMRQLDHFFTVDKLMASWLNENTPVRGHYLPPGVYGEECYISDKTSNLANDVVFVGSYGYHPEWSYRPQLIDWLKATYGPRFTHVGGGSQHGTVRGDQLNRLYANSKVVVGDSLCIGYDYPHYWSDRCPETLGRGGFLIHPYIKGMDERYVDDQHLVFYKFGEFDQLKSIIDYWLEHDEQREKIRRAGHEHAKAEDAYTVRWQTILDTVFG